MLKNDTSISFEMLPEDIDAIQKSCEDVSSKSLLSNVTAALGWAFKKSMEQSVPKSGAFAIRNHAFASEAEAPKSGAFAIRNHAFEMEAPKSGAFAIRNHAFAMAA